MAQADVGVPESGRPRFRVLGAVQLLGPAGPVQLHGERQRALLAALLCRTGAVVPTDRLVEELWPDAEHPANPLAALQSQVSRLRRAIADTLPGGARLLETVAPGYRLSATAFDVDAGLFDRLLTQSSTQAPAAAIGSLQEGLALWQGPAYAEFPDLPAARLEAIRLDEARASAVERLGELLVETGRLAEAVPVLEQLVAEHRLRERGRQALMRALHGLGRQADALASYQDYRDVLAEELGLEPSAAMQRLHLGILRHEVDVPTGSRTGDGTGTALDGLQVQYVVTPAGPVAVGTVGSGPPLVALPGWVSSLDVIASGRDPRSSLLQRLADRFTLTVYDRRGTGLSRGTAPDSSVDAALDELRCVVAEVGGPVTVLAMSQAGPVAVALAARSPELVERLVLFGTYAHGDTAFPNHALRESLVALMRSHHGVGSRLFAGFYRPGASPEASDHLTGVLRDSAPAEVAADYLEATYAADVRPDLRQVRCPTLVLHYRDDKVIPFAGGEQLAEALPTARFVALDGGFHLPDVHDLDPIVGEITRFAGHGVAGDAPPLERSSGR